jgi:NAD(P)-dependent dehydrogenase (short-subunit alcohol dehydrogenase family)
MTGEATMNPYALQGKTILVTGASSGLGRQIAVSCSRMGARLVVTGRDGARLAETFAALTGDGHRSQVADLTVASDLDTLVDEALQVDGVVHAAGVQRLVPAKLLSEKILRSVLDINLIAPMMLTQRLLHRNALSAGGSIIFLSSTAATSGTPGLSPYSASKAALHGFMRTLAVEQGKRRMRVNCIVPSAVETPMWDPGHLEAQRARHPLGLGTPDDVANAAIFLLSDASRWITGMELVMDGGIILVS